MNNKQNHMKGRQRGRNGGGGGKPRPPGRNPNFEGNNNNRPRGNAQQLMEKYLALARDATSAGDRVLAENYFQHADHYYRVLNARFEQQGSGGRRFDGQPDQGGQSYDRQGGDRGHDGEQGQQSTYQSQPHPQPSQHATQIHDQQTHDQQSDNNADREIALPPGILGDVSPEAASAESQEPSEGADTATEGSRPRQGGRRRRGGRSERPAVAVEQAGE
jgi:hypothetical protein